MSVPVVPNLVERLVLFRLNRGPAPMLDLFGAGGFEAVTLAIDLGLFAALSEGERTPVELADRLDADPEGLRALLDFLAAHGYVAADGAQYRNTEMTTRWLTDAAGTDMAPWFTF